MTKQEIINAILANKNVHWCNTGYSVIYNNNHLYVIFERNGFINALNENDLEDCFIKGE